MPNMIKQEDVTIIIPHIFLSKETDFALHHCLTSLLETCESKIVVVSNGTKFVMQYPPEALNNPRVSWIHLWDQGQCKSINAAVASTNTPWVLITNNDMVYPPNWFERLVEWDNLNLYGVDFKVNPNILCISPKLIEPRDGAPTFEKYFCGGAGGDFDKNKWLDFAKERFNNPTDDPWLRTGFNLPFLINRDLWDTVGGYDINYDPWGSNSDSDLEYKIRLAGVQPYQNTRSLVYHFSQTSGTFSPENRAYWHKNWNYFIDKWGFPRTDDRIWEADFHLPTIGEGRKYVPQWEGKYGI